MGDRGSGPHTYVQAPPEISANPLKNVFYNLGGSHVCIVTFTAQQQRKFSDPSLFWAGDATDIRQFRLFEVDSTD